MGYVFSAVSLRIPTYRHQGGSLLILGQTYESYNTSNSTQQHWVLMWAVHGSDAVDVRLNRTRDCITHCSFTPHFINMSVNESCFQGRVPYDCQHSWVASQNSQLNSMFSVYWSCSFVTARSRTTLWTLSQFSMKTSQQWRTPRPCLPHSLHQISGLIS